jgi:probable O-glycosylation ligase (exosortase A-associated)
MLRTLFVVGIILVGTAYSWRSPFYALLFYLWVAYFRPEYWLWTDFVSTINLSLIVGVFVVLSTLISGQKFRVGAGVSLMFLFLGQSLLSTFQSPNFEYAFPYWQDFAKSTVISYLITVHVNDERRFRLTLLVIALSLGAEGAKQGWVQLLLNPGGPNLNDVAILGDNNGAALGMLMLVPVFGALGSTTTAKPLRFLCRVFGIGVLYRAIVTYSRGGFLACGALGVHFMARSKHRIAAALTIALLLVTILPVLPEFFWYRLGTIQTATENPEGADESTQGRWHFWRVARLMAEDRPLIGVGHNSFNAAYDRYDPTNGEFGRGRSVHSSWFGVMAELGYPGLMLFVLLIGIAFRSCWRARKLSRRRPELEHLGLYAKALEAGFVVFAVGGTFVIFQYNEMLWHWFALSIALDQLVSAKEAALTTETVPKCVIPRAIPAASPVAALSTLPGVAGRSI